MLPRGQSSQVQAARTSRPRGATGKTGSNGIDGTAGTMIHKDDGPPDPILGGLGDFYVNGLDGSWYGPKTDSGWGGVIP